jgi:2-polyprenyl-3-methyl-5-hydroxy-6-metoxy-1,4-benzoquinol methylase
VRVSARGIEGFPPLICPDDELPLRPDGATLACTAGHRFDVRHGLPRIVRSASSYADAFGEQWNHYRTTQLDSYTQTSISKERLQRCLGPVIWARLHGPGVVDVLETGCGAGRFTEVLVQMPSARVTSTDLSSAVEANQVNCPQSDFHRVIQCDINRLPFPAASFDVVVCLGVLQHTPDPEAAIARLYAQAKPGGWLVIDHYAPSLSQYTKITANLIRPLLKRLPPRQGTAVTEALTRLFFPLHRAAKHSKMMQMAVSRLSPLLTYYHAYPQLDDRLQYEWALLDTHDSLTDYYKHFRTPGQIRRTLSGLGAQDVRVGKGGNGVEARCRKPGTEPID